MLGAALIVTLWDKKTKYKNNKEPVVDVTKKNKAVKLVGGETGQRHSFLRTLNMCPNKLGAYNLKSTK